MRRLTTPWLASTGALFGIAAILGTAQSVAAAGPSTPAVLGPRSVAAGTTLTLRLSARERGVPASRLRFTCSFDSPQLHRCSARIGARLAVGRHLLRARAIDPRGRRSPIARVGVVVRAAVAKAPEIRVGAEPVNVAFGAGALWVSNNGDGTVSRIDPATGAVTATVAVGGMPAGISAGDGAIWVGNFGNSLLTRIDPTTNAVAASIDVGGQPLGPAVASDGAVWVSNFDGSMERIQAASNSVTSRTVLGGKPAFTTVAFGVVWSVNQDGAVYTVDPASGLLAGQPIRIGDDVDAVSVSSDAVWVTTYNDGVLARIDPATRSVVWRKRLGTRLAGVLAATDGSVWVSLYDRGIVERVDPASGRVTRTVSVGDEPREIVEAAGSVWVVNQASGTVSRITP